MKPDFEKLIQEHAKMAIEPEPLTAQAIVEIVEYVQKYLRRQSMTINNIQQTHYGAGDNVAGNKTVNTQNNNQDIQEIAAS